MRSWRWCRPPRRLSWLPSSGVLREERSAFYSHIASTLVRDVGNMLTVLHVHSTIVSVHVRDNGRGIATGATHALPLLLLLDLNLPRLDGYQVLTRLKAEARTRRIPVIILTTTDEPYEIERCYALGCNVYITKPVAYEQFAEAIRTLGLFLSIVQIPVGK